MQSEHELRREVESLLRGPLPEETWTYLARMGLVEDALLEGGADFLAQEAREVLAAGGSSRGRGRKANEKKHIPADERINVVSEVLAAEANADPAVSAFRQKYLEGTHLALEELEAWVKLQATRDGPARPVIWAMLPDDHVMEHDLNWPGQGRIPLLVQPPLALQRVAGFQWHLLAYQAAGKPGTSRAPIRLGGVLAILRDLSQRLSQRYRWQEAQAATFVLTGVTPQLSQGSVSLTSTYPHNLARITLEVDPHMDPKLLLSLYQECRKELLPHRYRKLTPKHLELARFWSTHRQGTWQDRMKAWNSTYPEWHYVEYRNFSRDCRHAYRSTLGDDAIFPKHEKPDGLRQD
jgi:hypothetical protein